MATYNEIADKIHGVYHQLRITLDGVALPDKPDNVVFTNTVNDEGGLEVGTVYCSQVTFTIDNPSKDLKGEELYLEDGVRDTDGTFQYAPIGYFRVDTAVLDRGTVTYTCYDRMAYAFSGNYETALTFPATDKAIIEEICQKCKVPFTGQLTAHTITEKPTGINKTVLGYMLQLQGKNAFFNTAGTLEIKWYEKSEYTIDDSRIYSDGDASTTGKFTFGFVKNTRTVKKTETKYETQTEYDDDGNESTKQVPYTEETSEEQTYSAGDGLQGVSFQNPFMTQEIVTELYNKLKGFEYTPATFQVVGDFRIRVMTIITATTNNGISYAIPVMNVQHSCDGGVVDLISSYGQSESSNELADTSGLSRSMSRWDADIAYLKTAIVNVLSVERAKILYAEISSLNATNATIKKLDAETIKAKELTAEVAKLGYVTAATVEAQYARLDKANIPTAWIDTAMIGEGVVGTVQIKDGSITDAKIVGLTASKLTAGKIDAGVIEVVNLNAANITVGTINGVQIAPGAIDKSKLDSLLTDWISSTDTDVDKALKDAGLANDKIDNLEVGGRNLLKNSSMVGEKLNCSDIIDMNSVSAKAYESSGFHLITPTTGNPNNGVGFQFNDFLSLGINAGDTITFSLDVKGSSDSNKPSIRIIFQGKGSNWWTGSSSSLNTQFTPTSEFKRVYVTYTLPDSATLVSHTMWLAIHGNMQADLYIKNLKLEKGNKATDWTPAPEDVDAAIDSAVSIANGKATAYYQTTQPSGGTYKTNDLWFDTDGGYQMYYYNGSKWVATQYGSAAILASAITAEKIAASAVTSGKIAAGAVVADAIAANAVTAGKIATNAVTAGTIAANSVTTDKVAANAITSVKIATDAVTADKIVAGAITAAKIATGAITSDKILTGAVTADKLDVKDLYAIGATIAGFKIYEASIKSDTISITKNKIYVGDSTDYLDLTSGRLCAADSTYATVINSMGITIGQKSSSEFGFVDNGKLELSNYTVLGGSPIAYTDGNGTKWNVVLGDSNIGWLKTVEFDNKVHLFGDYYITTGNGISSMFAKLKIPAASNDDNKIVWPGDIYINGATSIADSISSLNSKLSDGGYVALNSYVTYRVKYGYCTLVGTSTGGWNTTAGGWINLGTLPTYARPSRTIYFHVNGLGGTGVKFGRISSGGVIEVWSSDKNAYWAFTAVYPI